ncbi:Phospho-2-dehydro-3-deoxyheptonate aldolase [Neolecta irregularis DAH-3]|uniref:Phospho-2-dehydro-3-deoxyheptonate aldolase n=1 Tax=Neolecta irregularis (strain DAH-3) TaxID=1198029 RepID=A0A1U7LQY3_NEOID|nr:Phospho-2-dehydro-3-deoxyheptonate aldolase [Neolecta irregularis DAH-3]|eukprot:OLL25038.1 Phospho-2-dehydro-3-deoxyheptonate aldolase [Neolecta irregularis DAH-3]
MCLQLEEVALNKAFLLQGGDCAELFAYSSQESIQAKLKVLLQMSLVLTWGAGLPIVRILRGAGQYAKQSNQSQECAKFRPRSSPTEFVDGTHIPSFRGDNVNGFDISEREPNPSRLVDAYFHSAATLNYIRALLSSGFADLHHPDEWSLSHVAPGQMKLEYQSIVYSLLDALRFMNMIGADNHQAISSVDLFTSHEALILEYEQSLTRKLVDPRDGSLKFWNTSAHFVWIGDRTRDLEGAHLEYIRGIENPVGIKVGPSMDPEILINVMDFVNPRKEPGKVTLISRYGSKKISEKLPDHIRAVQKSGHEVIWACDPMHGNTKQSQGGVKTRHFVDIVEELSRSIQIHKELGSNLNGVHFELTGDAVTECIGGSMDLKDEDLGDRYESFCDPRLNNFQSLDIAFLIANYHRNEREGEDYAQTMMRNLGFQS